MKFGSGFGLFLLFFGRRPCGFLWKGWTFDIVRRDFITEIELSEGIKGKTLLPCAFRRHLQKDGDRILSLADTKRHILLGRENKIGILCWFQSAIQGVGVCPPPHSDIEELGQGGRGHFKIEIPALVEGPDTILIHFEKCPVFSKENLIQVCLPDIAPAWFFVNGLQQLFEGDKAVRIRYKPEFIRPVPQDIDQEAGEFFDLYFIEGFLRQVADVFEGRSGL